VLNKGVRKIDILYQNCHLHVSQKHYQTGPVTINH